MQYRINQKNGTELSVLGYGCMRFSRKAGAINQEKAEQEMYHAMQEGVNYFDTAYIYTGSEACLGRFVRKYNCRDRIYIATKLPHYLIRKPEDAERYFQEELDRLQTDYIDYYLMHMLNDPESWRRLCALGIDKWIQDKKEKGIIRNIGFSFHGGTVKFKELVDIYDWDFCQIQFNYMDEHAQAGIDGLNYAHERGLPVIIMEPLRGGRLVNHLPAAAQEAFRSAEVQRTPADWALRWVWDHEQINVVLSGMNDLQQVEENCRVASEALPGQLTEADHRMFSEVLKAINEGIKVGCTGCGYCQPCPRGIDIPNCFTMYNNSYTDGYVHALREYMMSTTLRKDRTNASLCVECGLCESHCPQSLPIRAELKNVVKRFETPVYRIVAKGAGIFMKY
ncbi:MAG: aldo/keto reductase [Solobacterium sp.]|nr:aldo/keto reductase [Solobacterium sp.]